MQAYRTEITIFQDGKLSLKGLPFRKGDSVEVIVLPHEQKHIHKHYPLRGKPITYHKPFDSIVEDEWETVK